jgi:hypothetical protein
LDPEVARTGPHHYLMTPWDFPGICRIKNFPFDHLHNFSFISYSPFRLFKVRRIQKLQNENDPWSLGEREETKTGE